MKTYDNTIKYYELVMKYDDTSKYIKYNLPVGYHFEYYKSSDLDDWIDIHISSGEFIARDEGKQIFSDFYKFFINELDKRCVFIVENLTNRKVATVTVSLLKEKEYGYDCAIDWLAIRKEYQGKGLSKPLISNMIKIASDLGHKSIILHTQTTTWLAAKLYLDFGFEILNVDEKEGWSILKTLTNHSKLNDYNDIPLDEIYDERNVKIQEQLDSRFGENNYNYSVWYKNNLHNVYVYFNNKTYEYEYFIDNDKLFLKEVKNKKYKE